MLNTLPSEPLLNLALYSGLASLKLPACYDHSTKNVDCPVCDGGSGPGSSVQGLGMGKLAEEVPSSYHTNSTIICFITKKIMDADNMPMAFPNGYIYSREVSLWTPLQSHTNKILLQAMEEMATKNNGAVTCPRTGTRCQFTELRKVFIS